MTNYTRSELIILVTLRKARKGTGRVRAKNIRDDYSRSRVDDLRLDITRQSVVRNAVTGTHLNVDNYSLEGKYTHGINLY